MILQYTETHYVRKEVTVTINLSIPTHWGMLSSAGNKSLHTKARRLVKEVKLASETSEKKKAFEKFFRGWRSMLKSKTMNEAGDTSVRESVWAFAVGVGKAKGVSDDVLDDIWESSRN